MGGMADRDKGTDIDKLLAEVDGMLTGPAASNRRPVAAEEPGGRGLVEAVRARLRTAFVAGAVSGGVVWVLFAVLPFLRATSGAVGAFLAASVIVLVRPRRR